MPEGVIIECVNCGHRAREEEWQHFEAPGAWKCPDCGYRVGKKVRPQIAKLVKAR